MAPDALCLTDHPASHRSRLHAYKRRFSTACWRKIRLATYYSASFSHDLGTSSVSFSFIFFLPCRRAILPSAFSLRLISFSRFMKLRCPRFAMLLSNFQRRQVAFPPALLPLAMDSSCTDGMTADQRRILTFLPGRCNNKTPAALQQRVWGSTPKPAQKDYVTMTVPDAAVKRSWNSSLTISAIAAKNRPVHVLASKTRSNTSEPTEIEWHV